MKNRILEMWNSLPIPTEIVWNNSRNAESCATILRGKRFDQVCLGEELSFCLVFWDLSEEAAVYYLATYMLQALYHLSDDDDVWPFLFCATDDSIMHLVNVIAGDVEIGPKGVSLKSLVDSAKPELRELVYEYVRFFCLSSDELAVEDYMVSKIATSWGI